MELHQKIDESAEAWGADLCGIADLSMAHEEIVAQGGPVIGSYRQAISIGIVLPHAIVDQLPQRSDRSVAISYRHHCYEVINQRLDSLASRLSTLLQLAGYQALPVPASKRAMECRLHATFSHKLAAHLAGLGWIGKSCLLITPQAGPRVRWATVLTDAPLRATGQPLAERCGSCRECVDACPVRAFTGRAFRAAEPRSERYDAGKCDRYLEALKSKDPELAVCGLCLYICPHGRRRSPGEAG